MEILEVFAKEGLSGLMLFVLMLLGIIYFKISLGVLKDTKNELRNIRIANTIYHKKKLDPNSHFKVRHLE